MSSVGSSRVGTSAGGALEKWDHSYQKQVETILRSRPHCRMYYQKLVDYLFNCRETSFSRNSSSVTAWEVADKLKTVELFNSSDESDEINPRIYIQKGHLSPGSVNLLGAQLHLPPELFIGHLDFTVLESEEDGYYELPNLPSRRQDVIHVRLITLGKGLNKASEAGSSLQADRKTATENAKQEQRALFHGKRFGCNRFRNINIHNGRFFTVEQMVSFSVTTKGPEPWAGKFCSLSSPWDWLVDNSGVFLLDRGIDQAHDLAGTPQFPWFKKAQVRQRRHDTIVPSISYNIPSDNRPIELQPPHRPVYENTFNHMFDPIESCYLEDPSDILLLREDPFFILSRLLFSAALSWNQVINFTEEDIRRNQSKSLENVFEALEQFRFHIDFIDRTKGCLIENISMIAQGGSILWPKPSSPLLQSCMEEIQRSLLTDYESIINRCVLLSARCEASARSLVREKQLQESQDSIAQASQINKLTKLAFFFAPLTVVTGFFSMNMRELTSPLPIWVFFITSVCLSFAAFSVFYFAVIKLWAMKAIAKTGRALANGKHVFLASRKRPTF